MTPAEIHEHDQNRLVLLLPRHHAKDADLSWIDREGHNVRERIEFVLKHGPTVVERLPGLTDEEMEAEIRRLCEMFRDRGRDD